MHLPVDDSSSRSFQENNLFRNQEIDQLLLEKISLAAIARVANFSKKNACKIMSTLTMLKFLEKRSSAQKKEK